MVDTAAQSLAPWPVIGVVASDSEASHVITDAPASAVAFGIEVADGTVLAGSESSTTAGQYTFTKSGTTESALVYFIL